VHFISLFLLSSVHNITIHEYTLHLAGLTGDKMCNSFLSPTSWELETDLL